ncbi:hypothetical protein [Streptomyces sp. ADI93-02]|uniref:hypothetical protein n=1 Tax=Streptomyces sp. ADI93-02 TaxID=1522757 RepID=UPI000F5533BC|nr:hypothetical protein [Streptomyces sp. ADI93-02]RPK33392.1 Major intracellular serine protease precursor [Streptomyces sp. ADI93-02]
MPPGLNGARTSDSAAGFTGGIEHIWLDGLVEANLSDSTAHIGAPKVWSVGNTGQDVEVAVPDTGIDARHPDTVDRIVARQSFVQGENTDDYALRQDGVTPCPRAAKGS